MNPESTIAEMQRLHGHILEMQRRRRQLDRTRMMVLVFPLSVLTLLCGIVAILDPESFVAVTVCWLAYFSLMGGGPMFPMVRFMREYFRLRVEAPIPEYVAPAPQAVPELVSDPEGRARQLFERLLTPEQLKEWRRRQRVRVVFSNGRSATIGGGRVDWSDNQSQCVIPKTGYSIPRCDIYIAQLLHLRNDPNGLRAIGELPPIAPKKRSSSSLQETFRRLGGA